MTMRELSIALKRIDVRLHNQFAAQARLHQIEIPFRSDAPEASPEEIKVDEAQEKRIEKALRESMERKSEEFRRRQNG
jgi:hypothetical protein